MLYKQILKEHFKDQFQHFNKFTDIRMDYCFPPLENLLLVNLGIINTEGAEIEKNYFEIFFYYNGIYIINKGGKDELLINIFCKIFNFSEIENHIEFFNKAQYILNKAKKRNSNLFNEFSIAEMVKKNKFRSFNINNRIQSSDFYKSHRKLRIKLDVGHEVDNDDLDLMKKRSSSFIFGKDNLPSTFALGNSIHKLEKMNGNNSLYHKKKKKIKEKDDSSLINDDDQCLSDDDILIDFERPEIIIKNDDMYKFHLTNINLNKINEDKGEEDDDSYFKSADSSEADILSKEDSGVINTFSSDDLVYWIFMISIDRLQQMTYDLQKEAKLLQSIYISLEKETKEFYRRLDRLEEEILDIYGIIKNKKEFFKKSKEHFINFNNISKNVFFKDDFNFSLDLMIGRVISLELKFKQLKRIVTLIKENYSIVLEGIEKDKSINISYTFKALTIISTFFYVFAFIPVIFGMNIKIPFTDLDNYWPFFATVVITLGFAFVQLIIFRRLGWL